MHLERTTFIPDTSLHTVFAFFSDPRNLAKITPPSLGFRIVSAPARSLKAGDRIEYRIRIAGVPIRWVTLITEWSDGEGFVDTQEKGPYRKWVHRHTFLETDGGVIMSDFVEYELPFGLLGTAIAGWVVRKQIEAIFDFRGKVISQYFTAA